MIPKPLETTHVRQGFRPPETLTKRQLAERKAAVRLEQMTQKRLKEAEELKINGEI